MKRTTSSIRLVSCSIRFPGEGAVEINNKTYRLLPGSIFMIERPGPYKYWLPEGSDHWELKFIELSVNALPIWNAITQSFGQVFTMNETGAIITLWDEIFEKTQKGGIQSIYDNALYAYTFLLAVHKYLAEFGARSKNSESIQQCIDYIKENFAQNHHHNGDRQGRGSVAFLSQQDLQNHSGRNADPLCDQNPYSIQYGAAL